MDPRASVAARLRVLFACQHETLQEYMRLIRAQERSLLAESAERFEAQVEVERGLLDRAEAVSRACNALETIYRGAFAEGDPATEAARALAARDAAAVAGRGAARRAALEAWRTVVAGRLRTLRRGSARGPVASPASPRMIDISQ